MDRQYPIGKFSSQSTYTSQETHGHRASILELPNALESLTKSFTSTEWDTPYRENGWTARQVVHHLADSHMHAYIRCKWALTEENPVIKAYDEGLWANTPETTEDPLISLHVLKSLHAKWVILLSSLSDDQLARTFVHPVTKRQISIRELMALYAWHGEHHLAHLRLISD
jgi:hypothetical protein